MKRRVRFSFVIISALALLALIRAYSTPATILPPTLPLDDVSMPLERWQSLADVSLACREYANYDLSWQNWRNVPLGPLSADNAPDSLVADGDLLWIVSRYGLLRLDTRVWECTLFADARLGMPFSLLPDGQGGLWVGYGQEMGRFFGGHWRMISSDIMFYKIPATKLGLDWDGNLHVGLGFGPASAILDADTLLRIKGEVVEKRELDIADCSRWQRASGWSGEPRYYYDYMTQAGCEQIVAQLASSNLAPGALVAVSTDGEETWIVAKTSLETMRLTRQRGEMRQEADMPYQHVAALTLGRDAWMLTEDGIVRVQTRTSVQGAGASTFVSQSFTFSTDAFPGDVRSLVEDQTGGVWAINGYGALRYDELEQNWSRVISATRSADAIAADPDRGVWVAGRGELLRATLSQQQSWPLPDVITGTPTALLVGENRRLWLGTHQDGVWTTLVPAMTEAWDEPVALDWRQFTRRHGLADELITILSYGPDGRMYAGHHAGVSVFVPTNGDFVPTNGVDRGHWTTLPGSDAPDGKGWVNALAWSGDQLWVGYFNDLALRSYSDGHWTDYAWPADVLGIGALLMDDDGALWVGTTEGLWRWMAAQDGGEPLWEPLDPDSIVVHEALALLQDAAGRIWAGGREGSAMLEPAGE